MEQESDLHSMILATGGDKRLLSEANAKQFIHSPWPYTTLQKIPAHAKVAVVGTALTGVDVAKQLKAQGHQGPVILTSRCALLPGLKPKSRGPWCVPMIATYQGALAIAILDLCV